MPVRIQRKRTKGFRLPENTVYVGRPGRFGNPIKIGSWGHVAACQIFKEWLQGRLRASDYWDLNFHADPDGWEARRQSILSGMPELRGKNLACWCRLDEVCHGDVLLEMANRTTIEGLNK